jgi:hypothetical protein
MMNKKYITNMIVVLLVVAAIWLLIEFDNQMCSKKAELMLMNHHHSIYTGCMVEHRRDRWIPLSLYRVVYPGL